MLSPFLISSTRSTSMKGYRCGRYFMIVWMSIWMGSLIAHTLLLTLGCTEHALERGEPFGQTVEALEARDELAPRARILEGNTRGVYAGSRDRSADHRRAGDDHVVADRQMSADGDGAADLAARANLGAA